MVIPLRLDAKIASGGYIEMITNVDDPRRVKRTRLARRRFWRCSCGWPGVSINIRVSSFGAPAAAGGAIGSEHEHSQAETRKLQPRGRAVGTRRERVRLDSGRRFVVPGSRRIRGRRIKPHRYGGRVFEVGSWA